MLRDPSSVTRRSSRAVRLLPAFAIGAVQVVPPGSTVIFTDAVPSLRAGSLAVAVRLYVVASRLPATVISPPFASIWNLFDPDKEYVTFLPSGSFALTVTTWSSTDAVVSNLAE